jgi:transcription elongation GreA/GreB family factor
MKKVEEYLKLARAARADAERAEAAQAKDQLHAIAREWEMLADERRHLVELYRMKTQQSDIRNPRQERRSGF